MADLIDTTEMYLRTILELEEEGIVPLRARISERLAHSGPTVSQTIGRMERDGLVVVTDDRRLELTETGRMKAVRVMRKHRLAERLLADVIGLEWEFVHEEACRWEHVMSEQVELKLLNILDHPTVSPYGNLIPGLEELGGRPIAKHEYGVVNATGLFTGMESTVTARVRRFAEPLQVDPLVLRELLTAGIKPGVTASFTELPGTIRIAVPGTDTAGVSFAPLELPVEVAAHIFVSQ